MEYLVRIAGGVPDLARVQRELAALDPACVLDFDAGAAAMRVSTWATLDEVHGCLSAAGLSTAGAPELQPSVCCGGCSFG